MSVHFNTQSPHILPLDVWGEIARHGNIGMKLRAVSRMFSNRTFGDIAFQGTENQLATMLVKQSDLKKRSIATELQNQLGARVSSLDLVHIAVTFEKLSQLAKLYPNVEKLSVKGCDFTEIDIQVFAQFSKLKSLTIVESIIPDTSLGHLPTSLAQLVLDNCALTDNQLIPLQQFDHLEELRLPKNQFITGRTFDHLPKKLKILDCNCCDLRDDCIAHLATLDQLATLDVSHNPSLSSISFYHLPASLLQFNCTGCRFAEDAVSLLVQECIQRRLLQSKWLASLASHHPLRQLTLDGSSYYPTLLEQLAPLFPKLEALSLCETGSMLTDDEVKCLARFRNLRQVDLNHNYAFRGTSFGDLPLSLESLRAPFCALTDSSIALLKNHSKLRRVDIGGNHNITAKALFHLPAAVQELGCANCLIRLTEEEAISLITQAFQNKRRLLDLFMHVKMPPLRKLDLSSLNICQGQLLQLGLLIPTIEELSLCKTGVTDELLKELAQYANLQVLDISNNEQIQGTTLDQLPKSLTLLKANYCSLTRTSKSLLESRNIRVIQEVPVANGKRLWELLIFAEPHAQLIERWDSNKKNGGNTFGMFAGRPDVGFIACERGRDLATVDPDTLIDYLRFLPHIAANPEICLLECFRVLEERKWAPDESAPLTRIKNLFSELPIELQNSTMLRKYYINWAPLKWLQVKGYDPDDREWKSIKRALADDSSQNPRKRMKI